MSGLLYSCPECKYELKAQAHQDPPGMYDCPKCNVVWMIINFTTIPKNVVMGFVSHYGKNPLPEKVKDDFRRSSQ